MQRPLKKDVDEDEEEEDDEEQPSYFHGALKCVFELQKRKALKNPSDLVGILIYNTVSSHFNPCRRPLWQEERESMRARELIFLFGWCEQRDRRGFLSRNRRILLGCSRSLSWRLSRSIR